MFEKVRDMLAKQLNLSAEQIKPVQPAVVVHVGVGRAGNLVPDAEPLRQPLDKHRFARAHLPVQEHHVPRGEGLCIFFGEPHRFALALCDHIFLAPPRAAYRRAPRRKISQNNGKEALFAPLPL